MSYVSYVSVGLGDGDWKAKLSDQRGIQIKVFWVMVPGPANPYGFPFLWSWELTHPNYHEAWATSDIVII